MLEYRQASGVLVIIFGTFALRAPGISSMDTAWLLQIIVYGFGSALIIVAIIQLWACKTENRFAIFLVIKL